MTTVTADQLFDMAQALEPEQRRKLVVRLTVAAEDDDDLDDAWLEKMRGRIDDVRSGKAQLFTGTQVRERLKKHLAKKR